jgi:hypothetical protein
LFTILFEFQDNFITQGWFYLTDYFQEHVGTHFKIIALIMFVLKGHLPDLAEQKFHVRRRKQRDLRVRAGNG